MTQTLSLRYLVLSAFCLTPLRADVFEYVKRPEPKFEWTKEATKDAGPITITDLRFTSQVWQGIEWKHLLRVFVPKQVTVPGYAMLLITGGNGSEKDNGLATMFCSAIGAPFAILYNIPNQPLFGGKKEDALIAHTFVKCMETGDTTWPLLFPMTKSAVKAMDVLQAYGKEAWKTPVEGFVVTGASKRGWTTWFTGAVDERVKGIAPIVYDNLDLVAQMKHQLEMLGAYSDQIDDYTELNLQTALTTEKGKLLAQLVDPYTYRNRITMPKLIINGTNDPYWTQDGLNLYWDGLVGPKHVLYVPNKGHDVGDMERLLGAMRAFFAATVKGQQLPRMDWRHDTAKGKCRLAVACSPDATAGALWVARSATKDFRKSTWIESEMTHAAGKWLGQVDPPEEGYLALFGELTFEGNCKLSTQIRIVSAAQ